MSKRALEQIENTLFTAHRVMATRHKAARHRAELLGTSSNVYDRGLDGTEPTPAQVARVDRFIRIANKAAGIADDLESRMLYLHEAAEGVEAALKTRGDVENRRARDKRKRRLAKSLA